MRDHLKRIQERTAMGMKVSEIFKGKNTEVRFT